MLATRPRTGAYIWVTWLVPFLVGANSCLWSAWFKAHFFYAKRHSFDDTQWCAEHAPLVAHARDALIADEFTVTEEEQNKFTLTNGNITLAGKPDLVGVKGTRAVIVDCKTGCPRPAHRAQLMIYMLVLPCVRPELKGYEISGLIEYSDDAISIPTSAIDEEFRHLFRTTVHTIGGPTPPKRAPSPQECGFCSISVDDCPQRLDEPKSPAITDHDLF